MNPISNVRDRKRRLKDVSGVGLSLFIRLIDKL